MWRGLDFQIKEDEMAWLNQCFVGYVHNPDAVYLLQDRLVDEGVFSFTIVPMGGEMVLIKPTEGEDFVEFVKDYESLVETWFYDLRQWSPDVVVKEREAWIRCQGVPLHAWSSHFFEKLVSSLGKFVSMDSNTMLGKRFDVARVLIRTTSREAVNRLIKVRINGVFYNIRLLEEPFPEFVFKSINKSGKGVNSSSSSESQSLSDFSLGSLVGNSIDSDVELDIEKLFEEEELISVNGEVEGRRIVEENNNTIINILDLWFIL